MSLNIRLFNIISNGSYTVRYKEGDYPYPETIDSTFTLFGTNLTDNELTITGLTFDTQYWIKMTDEETGRYIIKNIHTNDAKTYPCYYTICFDVETVCLEPTPTPSVSVTPTPTPSTPPCQCKTYEVYFEDSCGELLVWTDCDGIIQSKQADYFGYDGLNFPANETILLCSCTEPSGGCTPVMTFEVFSQTCDIE
jgi:hypothetical protein